MARRPHLVLPLLAEPLGDGPRLGRLQIARDAPHQTTKSTRIELVGPAEAIEDLDEGLTRFLVPVVVLHQPISLPTHVPGPESLDSTG